MIKMLISSARTRWLAATSVAALAAATHAAAQDSSQVEELIVTGVRGVARTVVESPAPSTSSPAPKSRPSAATACRRR